MCMNIYGRSRESWLAGTNVYHVVSVMTANEANQELSREGARVRLRVYTYTGTQLRL